MFKLYVIFAITLLILIVVLPLFIFVGEDDQLEKTDRTNMTTAVNGGYFTEKLTESTKSSIPTTNFIEEMSTPSQSTHRNTTTYISTNPVNDSEAYKSDKIYTQSTESSFSVSEAATEETSLINYNCSPEDARSDQMKTETFNSSSEKSYPTTDDDIFSKTIETVPPTVSKIALTTKTVLEDQTTLSNNGIISTTEITILTSMVRTTDSIKSTDTTTSTLGTTIIPLMVPFKTRKNWYPGYPDMSCLVPLSTFIKSVLIRQTLYRNCIDADDCSTLLKGMLTKDKSGNPIDINYNFIIGGDGVVYEARGFTCRTDNPNRFYTPPIDELHLGLTGNVRENNINNLQLENMKKFLYEGSQQGTLKKFVDGYLLESFHDTSETCSCPIQQPALVETCGPCVLKRSFPQ